MKRSTGTELQTAVESGVRKPPGRRDMNKMQTSGTPSRSKLRREHAGREPAAAAVVDRAVRDSAGRIRSWGAPPNWSAREWFNEEEAVATAAAWHGAGQFDASIGKPFADFLRGRILAAALTRFRQEWRFAIRFLPLETVSSPRQANGDAESRETASYEELHLALECMLPEDVRLLSEHFWAGYTEAELATRLGLSQPAVSEHLKRALHDLRQRLGTVVP
jgi:RNA polymerase sigma factor (sigma-70 family)